MLIDTVGFVKNIPHNLIEAFQSTLESAAKADLVLIVCDATGDYQAQIKTTEDTLAEMHCEAEKLLVMNKLDKLLSAINDYFKNSFVSIDKVFAYDVYKDVLKLEKFWIVKSTEFLDNGVRITASIPKEHYFQFKPYL